MAEGTLVPPRSAARAQASNCRFVRGDRCGNGEPGLQRLCVPFLQQRPESPERGFETASHAASGAAWIRLAVTPILDTDAL